MDSSLLIPIVGFVAIVAGEFAVMSLFGGDDSRAAERLDELRDPTLRNKEEKGVSNMLEKAAPKMAAALGESSEYDQNALKTKLANAGYLSNAAPAIFQASRVASAVGGLLMGGGYGVMKEGFTSGAAMPLALGAGVGLYLPSLILKFKISARKERIFLSLPDALDLLVVCTEAGLGFDAAMNRVSSELEESAPDICEEFQLCQKQLNELGRPRKEVLRDLALRTDVDDVRSIANVITQAEKFGSSIAKVLRQKSDEMRERRKQMAEEKAQQTAVKLIFPLVLFIFPGIFVVLVGPAAIMMVEQLFTMGS